MMMMTMPIVILVVVVLLLLLPAAVVALGRATGRAAVAVAVFLRQLYQGSRNKIFGYVIIKLHSTRDMGVDHLIATP